MATEDEAREAADGTEVQVEAVDLGTVHLHAHPEGKLSSLMEIKSMGETVVSTEGTLKIPEDQVFVEAPSDVQLPPEHNLNGEASSVSGHTDKEEKVSIEQPHDNDQEEAELDQSNGINKEDVTDGLSHGESTPEDSCLLKHKKDEEPQGDDQQDLGVTVNDDSVQEDTLKTDNAIEQTDVGQQDQNQEPEEANENTEPASITSNADVDNAIEQTNDGQQDQNPEPEKANENTEPASIANNADVEIVAEAPTGLQAPVERRANDSDGILETIDEKRETYEPAKEDDAVHPEEMAKVEDQQSQQADMMDADVAPEEIKCEETDQQEEKPKSEAHEPTIDAQGVLSQESAEETDDLMNEKIKETAHQRNVAAPKETTLEHEATMSAPPVNTQVQNQESLEEIEDTEAEIQPNSGFGDAIPEDQSNLGVTIDNDTVNEDRLRAIEQQDDGQQDEDLEPEKAIEHTQSASMANIPHVEIVTEAPSGVQTPGETNLDNSDAVPDTIAAKTKTDDPAKAHTVINPNQKESFPEDTSNAEPTEEVVKAEDQQSQQADAMDANMVQEEVPKSEHADEPATDALEVLNQESAEEIDGPVNTEGTAHKETTPVDIQAHNWESLEEREATVEEREVAEAVDTEAPVQQSTVAFEEAVLEDQHNLGVTNNTVQEDTLEATGQTEGEQYQDLGTENATEDTQLATTANIPDVEVIAEAPSGIQTPVGINLDISDSIPDTTDGNTEIDEPAKAHDVAHPDKKENFLEDTSTTEPTEEAVRLEDQQSQQADAMDADVVQELVPKFEHTDEPATDALEVLNQESSEEIDGSMNQKTEETAHQSNMPASEEKMPQSDATTREPPVTIHVQNQESSGEREATVEEREVAEAVDTEAPVQQSSVAFEEAVPEDQHYLGVTNNTVQEDTVEATGQTEDDHQYQELGPENTTENTQPASMANIPDVEVITEAPSVIQTPVEINLDISDAIPDTTDGNTEADEPAKAHADVHPDKKESFLKDTSTAEPTEEVVKVEDQQNQQADAMDADVVQEEVPKSEYADEPATDALEVLNQESAEETDGPVNENTEETTHQSNMPASEEAMPEYDATRELPVTIQVQNQESLEEIEAKTVEEREVADAVDTEATVQPSSSALEVAVPEDQHNLGATNNTVQEETLKAIGQTKDGQQYQDLGPENATEDTQPASMETEAVPHESNVADIKESTEDDASTPNAPHTGSEPVRELESVEDSTDTTEHPGETHGSTSDDHTPTEENTSVTDPSFNTQEVQNLTSQEIKDSEDDKTEEFSHISSFPTPGEADQVPRIEPTPDVQEVQELGLTEETRDIEAMEPEDQQEHIVSTLEKPAVDGEPNGDDQQVHEDKLPEVEDNKAIEVDEASKQSNIATPDNAAGERNELESDPDSYAQPAEQVELSIDNENNKLVKAEETSDQSSTVALEERTEDSVASEIDPPVDIKQEQPVEEIKGVDATEAEEDFHTSQADAIEKLASDNNIATIEPTYDIQQVDDLEATEEKQRVEAINDGEQSNIAVSEEPTPTDNGATPEDQHVESNEGTMGNETDNVILAHGIKDEIQKSTELKDDPCDLGETVFTTQSSENLIDEDAVQTSVSDTVETSNNIYQVKEEPNAGTEHNSSQMASEHNGENTTHVQDRDIDVQILTESGNADASQALFENDPQAAQDTTEKDETTKGSEQTIHHNSRQHCDVALQQQSCETDALSILEQDEALQKIDSDQKQKEDEEIESQNDELQIDEQKHEDKRDDLTTEPLVEYQNFENGATNKTKDNDAFEADQTKAVISGILKNEATPSIMDMKVENTKETREGIEDDDDAKNDNKEEHENAENDDVVAKTSTSDQAETTDEIRKEEIEPGLVSSVQEASDPAPSKDKILENDLVHVIQASEKEIADEIEESKEIHEDNAICHDELQTNSKKEESPQLRSNEPYNVDAKIDATPLCEEIIHDNASIKPRETEEIGENKGLDSTSEPSVESSIQNNVEDSSNHHEVEDEKLSMSEKNDVDTEAMQEKNDESAADLNQTEQCQEEINADDVLQLETEEHSFDKIEETASHEETEISSTTATEAVTINDDITDKVSGADGAPSNGSLKTFTDTGRDLDVSLVITTSKEESVNDNMENLNLDLPGHPAQDDNTPEKVLSLEETEREVPLSENLLQTEPGENQIPNEQDEKDKQDENQTPKERNEEDVQDTEFGEAKKEVEQELPVSHFLMNLILGKESSDANEDSESKAARKQGEATEDGSCAFISKQEENLQSLPTENKVDDNLTFVEQEKHEVKCPEETQEMVKEQSDDLKMDTERSIKTDEDIKKNTHDLEIPAYQDNTQDEISGELLTGEAAGVSTKMETRDIDISSVELDDRAVGTVCQENMEESTKTKNGSLRSSLNDSTNTKAPKEDTLGEEQTGLVLESLPEDKSVDAVSEQAPLLTESGMTDANDLSSDTASVQNPVSAKEDKPTESANIEATCSTDIQLENEEVDKNEEEQHANTATDEVSEENVESSHVNLQKITSSEVTSNELATQITEPVCDTQTILAHEKEISEENFPTAVEIQADGPNLQINQDKQDEVADNESAMELEKVGESNFQEHQEIGTEQKSPEEIDEGGQQLLAKKEILTHELDVHETVESPQQTVSIKSNEDQELFDPKVQERDLNVVSPREASEAEENFVDVSKLWLIQSPEADAEQSPKADAEESIYEEKIKDIEGTKNFTDEAAMKTEAPGAAQKALKKQSLLSGVGSKVKHQLAKVKKAIVGKPGRTKPESPKA